MSSDFERGGLLIAFSFFMTTLKYTTSLVGFFFFLLTATAQQQPPYKNPKLPIDQRVQDLLGRMTPEEKFFQLFMIPGDLDNIEPGQYTHGIFGLQVSASSKGSGDTQQMLKYNTAESGLALTKKINAIQKFFIEKTRLGIPIIAFDEALHGLVRDGATSFPQSIGLAATFDTTLMREVATAIAAETKARGIRQILSPVINIASDVRWGRVEETYGEDPFLTSAMGVAFVSQFEKAGIITTPKHLIANVGDGGRDSYPIHWNERYMEEIHFPPFIACLKKGGSRSVMTSYNSYDGSPSTANDWLLNKKLKTDWDFKGFVISDASATGGSVVLHNTAPDMKTAAQQAIEAGLDVIFQTEYRHHQLFNAGFLNGKIDPKRIDDAVARVLRAKFELGLFENPYMPEGDIIRLSKSNSNKLVARKAALESIVLLKNEKNVLPLSKNIHSIAVIGQDAMEGRQGGYSGPGNGIVSILDGIRQRAKGVQVTYAEGCKRIAEDWKVIPAEFLSNESGQGLKGEYYSNLSLQGGPAVTKVVDKIDFLWTLSAPDKAMPKSFYSIRWTGKIKSPESGIFKIGLDGNDGFRLYINSKLLIDNWKKQTYQTALVDFPFEKDKAYDLKVEFFETVGNARIRLIWNVDVDHDWKEKIENTVAIAKNSDVAVVVAGIHEGEFQDRALLSLPGHQEELINAIASTGKPVVVVLIGGSAITMNGWVDHADGIIDAWYPGEDGGNAVAQVLFGDYNPAGRLPVTFPLHEAQLPLVYNHKPTGRGDDYYNLSGLPRFPFGFGLSYTTFEYSNIKLDDMQISKTGSTRLRCTIKNTGAVAGDEVVQLYITDVLASVARPVMELKGFTRIHLSPGESKDVLFVIEPSMLSMLDLHMKTVVEPGEFKLMVGASSRDIRLQTVLNVGQ
jgi:beta-glucosidase